MFAFLYNTIAIHHIAVAGFFFLVWVLLQLLEPQKKLEEKKPELVLHGTPSATSYMINLRSDGEEARGAY